jgi:iron complex outermembrane receptor protein
VSRGSGTRLDWFADYTFLDATFRDAVRLASANNPLAVGGEIFVQSGDRLPLVPRHLLKAGVRYRLAPKLTVGGDMLASGGQYVRGDEANLVAPLDGYSVFNLHVEYQSGRIVQLLANVDNLLDARYETFGVFGDATQVLGPAFDDRRYASPGAPRGGWVGVRLSAVGAGRRPVRRST